MTDTKVLIENAAMKAVSIYGLRGVRVKHIGKLSGLTNSSIYTYFSGEQELMTECFEKVDHQVAALFDNIDPEELDFKGDPEGTTYKLWLPYFEWFIAHPDETIFYKMYREDPGYPAYNAKRDISHFSSFMRIINEFEKAYPDSVKYAKSNILWIHFLNGTLTYARYVIDGTLPYTEKTEKEAFEFLMNVISCFFKSEE